MPPKKKTFFTYRIQAVIVVVVALGVWGIFFYLYVESLKYGFQADDRRIVTLFAICNPLEKKFDVEHHRITCFRDGAMGIDITVNDPGQAFDIAREIDALRKNDPLYLSKVPIRVHIQSAESGPNGVDFRVELPGDPGYDFKRDKELSGKLEESIRRLEWEQDREEMREKYPESDNDSEGVKP